jgi:arsenite-transporting ATPase
MLATLRSAVVPGRSGAAAAALGGVSAVEELLDRVPLTDPARTAVHLVLRPDQAAADEVLATATALGVHGQRVATVTVDRLLPALPGEWGARRAQAQQGVLARLAELAVPLRQVEEAAVPPSDVPALQALAAAVPVTGTAPVPPPGPQRAAGGWVLGVPLPFARRGEVELTRWTDDLVVTAAGQRRSLPLDPLLRRCTVSGGTLIRPGTAEATLEVRFTPDPVQWPAGLLEAQESTA